MVSFKIGDIVHPADCRLTEASTLTGESPWAFSLSSKALVLYTPLSLQLPPSPSMLIAQQLAKHNLKALVVRIAAHRRVG
jgi:hypothetical protein